MTILFKAGLQHLAGLATCAALFSVANPVYADGFHYQLQAATQFVGNATGELTALKMDWTYDPELTAILLEDEDLSAANQAATLQQRATDILEDLGKLGYFSTLTVDGTAVALNKVQDYQMTLTGDQSMVLSFTLPLKASVPVARKKISLRLADPDGVGTLFYKTPQDASVDANLAKTCSQPTLLKDTLEMPNAHKADVPTAQTECK